MDYSEAVRVEYDPALITFKELVQNYFRFHLPTSPRSSRQYRSAILYDGTAEERDICDEVIKSVEKKRGVGIYVDVEERTEFYRAEEYHQDYLKMMGTAKY